MASPFIGEIRIVSFDFAPKGWAGCGGQLLPISQNQALFSLIGTTFGGDGRTTFALPDFHGRIPVSAGGSFVLGEKAGEEAHTLSRAELPKHVHTARADNAAPTSGAPGGGIWAKSSYGSYSIAPPNTTMAPGSIAPTGGGQPHENRAPFLALLYVIAIFGIYPSRN